MTSLLSAIRRRARLVVAGRLYSPRLKVERHNYKLVRLGTERYGGWTFVDSPALYGATILSCGLGQDASFDVEFAAKYGARVVIVDPTPSAISHFSEIVSRVGQPSTSRYSGKGKEEVTSYDLTTVSASQLELLPYAIWKESGCLKFYRPPNPAHVSHSINNFQNSYKSDTASISVEAITPSEVLRRLGLAQLPILKLDIEGAEVEVLEYCMTASIRPAQILVEFDELNVPSSRSRERALFAHRLLTENGYSLIHHEYPSDFLYVLRAQV